MNGKFVGKSTVKVNALMATSMKEDQVAFEGADDAQVDTKVGNFGFQTKLKKDMVSFHTDFGMFKTDMKLGKEKSYTFWHNPYMAVESSRGLKMNSVYLGAITHLCSKSKANVNSAVPREPFEID